jgi:hypothetical protein
MRPRVFCGAAGMASLQAPHQGRERSMVHADRRTDSSGERRGRLLFHAPRVREKKRAHGFRGRLFAAPFSLALFKQKTHRIHDHRRAGRCLRAGDRRGGGRLDGRAGGGRHGEVGKGDAEQNNKRKGRRGRRSCPAPSLFFCFSSFFPVLPLSLSCTHHGASAPSSAQAAASSPCALRQAMSMPPVLASAPPPSPLPSKRTAPTPAFPRAPSSHLPCRPPFPHSPTPSSCCSPSGRSPPAPSTSTRPCPKRSRVREEDVCFLSFQSDLHPRFFLLTSRPSLFSISLSIHSGVITIFEGVLKTRQRQNTQITYSAADLHAWLDTLVSGRGERGDKKGGGLPIHPIIPIPLFSCSRFSSVPFSFSSPRPACWSSTPSPRYGCERERKKRHACAGWRESEREPPNPGSTISCFSPFSLPSPCHYRCTPRAPWTG